MDRGAISPSLMVLLPFKKTSFLPLYVEYVDEIFNPHPHIPHIPHMRIIRIFRIFRIRMANPNQDAIGKDEHFKMLPMCPATKLKELLPFPGEKTTRWSWEFGPTGKLFPP